MDFYFILDISNKKIVKKQNETQFYLVLFLVYYM